MLFLIIKFVVLVVVAQILSLICYREQFAPVGRIVFTVLMIGSVIAAALYSGIGWAIAAFAAFGIATSLREIPR